MQLCQMLDNQHLMQSCLLHIETNFDMSELCLLFKCAINSQLNQVSLFCTNQMQSYLSSFQCDQLAECLFQKRQHADLVLKCTHQDGTELTLTVHRLIIYARSQLYHSFCILKQNQSLIRHQVIALNKKDCTSIDKLVQADQINFSTYFNEPSLHLFVHFVYCCTQLSTDLTIEMSVNLLALCKVLNERLLEQACIQ